MKSEDFGLGLIFGAIGATMVCIIVLLFVFPSGIKSSSKECLEDHPSICRYIVTFTTEYKEVK